MAVPWRRDLGSDRLLVSGFGRWGGGVYDLTSGEPHAYDDLPTSGLALGGGRLWRVLRAPGELTATCELLGYDGQGVRSYLRLDAVRDPHDVCWHDGAVHLSSSWDAAVWRVDPSGATEVVWQGGTVPDSWHVNSLIVVDGRLHVCAFGRGDRFKGWKGGQDQETGFVHDTGRGVDVLAGLSHPHSPRWVAERQRWYVCESTKGSLAEYDPDGRLERRVRIRRFSRGLAVVGRWAFVGGNAHRQDEDDRAEIAVVDLDRFEVVDQIGMPCLEVYDIVPAPYELARGLAVGFGANPARSVEQHRGVSRSLDKRPTPPEASVQLVNPVVATKLAGAGRVISREVSKRFRIDVDLPRRMTAGEVRVLPARVANRSPLPAATVVPNPIRFGARWMRRGPGGANGQDDPGARTIRDAMSPLPRLLHAGDAAPTELVLQAPTKPGRYRVRVAFHQPGLGWFGRRVEAEVDVVPGPESRSVLLGSQGGEEDDVADVVGVGEQHHQAVHADSQPPGGR